MYKVIAVYKAFDEARRSEFEDHFKNIHTPICLKIPGIREVRVNRIFGGPAGTSHLQQVVEMVFDSKESWKAAMKTPEMMESGKDAVRTFGDLVSVHFAEENIIRG